MSRGNSDHHEADRLKQEADFFIETGQVKTLVFDFAGTEFMDSPESGGLSGGAGRWDILAVRCMRNI